MKTFIVIVVIAILVIGGYFAYRGSYKKSGQSQSSNNSISADSTGNVNISNFSFNPASITVKAGSVITFTNNDSVTHTVTADDGKFSQEVNTGKTTTITISDPGIYNYYCSIHPPMKGTIIVQ